MSETPPPYSEPPPYAAVPQYTPPGPRLGQGEERTWATAAHWSALVAAFVALAFLGPLVVLLAKGNESPWVRRNAVESLNFQLSMLIYGFAGSIVAVVLVVVTLGLGLILIIPLALAFAGFWMVMTIIGAVKSGNGEDYRYPLTIRMVN